jgi:hypothetical protein
MICKPIGRPSSLRPIGIAVAGSLPSVAMLIRMVCFADRIGNGAGRARIAFGDVLISRGCAAPLTRDQAVHSDDEQFVLHRL